MAKVEVKAVEGRVAFTAPRGGVRIPTDSYITVNRTSWIERLLNHHQDITEKSEDDMPPVEKAKAKSKSAPADTSSGDAPGTLV